MKIFRLSIIITLLLISNLIFADSPNTVAYRGQLTDETGNVLDATVDITFNIFDVATGGTSLWSETQSVIVTDGYFDVELGSITAIDLNFDSQYWVELTIDSETLAPRDKLTPTAYSIRSNIANKADSSIYSVSSSADHEGRIGHVRFIPGEGGSITEAAASSETDTIYIAIGGGTGSATTASTYPPGNINRGSQGSSSASSANNVIYTVPANKVFYLYSLQIQVSSLYGSGYYIYITEYDGSTRNSLASCSSYTESDMAMSSSPVVINFDPPQVFEEGTIIEYSIIEYDSGTGIYGYHIHGYEGNAE